MIAPDLAGLAVPTDKLRLLDGNPRRGDVDAIARSLAAFGQRKPVVARHDGEVIAGNHTLLAARSLGWDQVAVVWVDDDDTTAHAYALADNRTAELGGYDDAALAALICEVHDADEELLAATGWSGDDLQALLDQLAPTGLPAVAGDVDEVPATAPAITVPGDVWLLGDHRVMCGDCRVPTDVDRLLDGATVNLAVTSPPYAEQRDYDESSGFRPIKPDDYVEWFAPVAANVAAHLADDGSWLVNIKPSAEGLDTSLYVLDLVAAHVRRWGWHWATEFCWERSGVPKIPARRFKNQFEAIYQFARNDWKFRPDAVRHATDAAVTGLGSGTGIDTNAARAQGTASAISHGQVIGEGLAYPGNRLPTFAGSHQALGHGAAFPVGLPQWFTKAYTDPGDVVLDPFVGSGSTVLAAHLEGRRGYGMEISTAYVDTTCKRFEQATGIVPVAEATGREHSFADG